MDYYKHTPHTVIQILVTRGLEEKELAPIRYAARVLPEVSFVYTILSVINRCDARGINITKTDVHSALDDLVLRMYG
jgi:hypothetical protein